MPYPWLPTVRQPSESAKSIAHTYIRDGLRVSLLCINRSNLRRITADVNRIIAVGYPSLFAKTAASPRQDQLWRAAPMHRQRRRGLLGLVCLALVTASGCAVDNRTGALAAAALLETEVRPFAAEQALQLAQAAVGLHRSLTASAGPELPAARGYWQAARGSYDQASTVCLLLAPVLDLRLDGRFDNPLALGGLRQLERALFAQPRADDVTLQQLAQAFRDDSLQLPGALSDTRQPLDPAQLLTTMSAVVAVVGTKADGSDSPYAGTAHLAIQNNLSGLQHMYTVLSPLIRAADAALDAQVLDLFAALQQQVAGLSTVDALVDKVLFLRRCAELSQALLRVNTALGLVATAVVDVT